MGRRLARAAVVLAAFGLGVFVGARWCGEAAVGPERAPLARPAGTTPEEPARARQEEAPVRRDDAVGAPRDVAVGRAGDAAVVATAATRPADVGGCHPRPGLEPALGTPSARGGRPLTLETFNDCDDTVTSSWLDYEGKEQGPSIVLPGARLNTSTWGGHVFRLRLGDRKRTFLRDVVAPRAGRARLAVCGCGAEGGPSTDAMEILDGGREAVGEAGAPQCLVPFDPEPAHSTPSVTLSDRYPVVFRNTCSATKVRVDWVQFDGGMRWTADVEPGAQFDQQTFVGHQWRVRDAMTSRWIRDFALDGGAVVDLCACQ